MAQRQYCKNCKRQVRASTQVNWVWFIIFCLSTFGIVGLLYLFMCWIRGVRCPICKDNNWR